MIIGIGITTDGLKRRDLGYDNVFIDRKSWLFHKD